MTSNFVHDWPVYVLLGAVIWFFIYVVISSHKDGKDMGPGNKDKGKNP